MVIGNAKKANYISLRMCVGNWDLPSDCSYQRNFTKLVRDKPARAVKLGVGIDLKNKREDAFLFGERGGTATAWHIPRFYAGNPDFKKENTTSRIVVCLQFLIRFCNS